jgi:hypothetical protein
VDNGLALAGSTRSINAGTITALEGAVAGTAFIATMESMGEKGIRKFRLAQSLVVFAEYSA